MSQAASAEDRIRQGCDMDPDAPAQNEPSLIDGSEI
jgi:hypothetical protein